MVGQGGGGVLAEVQGRGDLGRDGAVGELEAAGRGCTSGGVVVRVEEVVLQRPGEVDGLGEEGGTFGVQGREVGVVRGEGVEHVVQVCQRRAR